MERFNGKRHKENFSFMKAKEKHKPKDFTKLKSMKSDS